MFFKCQVVIVITFINILSTKAELETVTTQHLTHLEDIAKIAIEKAWKLANTVDDTNANVTMSISEFWKKLKLIYMDAHVEIKHVDHLISHHRPASTMNKILDVQDLTTLKVLSDISSQNPYPKWRVKWVETTSMASQVHQLYNKRIRDIMNDEPYVKTVAMSVQKYMSHPWFSKLSGNGNDQYRARLQHYPKQILERMMSVPEGDLFLGLRRLIEDNPTAAASSGIEFGYCTGNQTMGKIVPSSGVENALYILMYLGLVDIKFFMLINFLYIYEWVYESIEYLNQNELVRTMHNNLQKKIKMYEDAFQNSEDLIRQLPKPVEPGYFRCDPLPVDQKIPIRAHMHNQTYIKFTNFLSVFPVPEKELSAMQSCRGRCERFDGVYNYCNSTASACDANFDPDCLNSTSDKCSAFNPPCPIADLVCVQSAMNLSFCPVKDTDRVMESASIDGKLFGGDPEPCPEKERHLEGSADTSEAGEQCEVCLCHCYSPVGSGKNSVRSFSLKPAVADVVSNKIVVGVQFILVDNQVHLMIAEAEAETANKVKMSSVVWKKPKAVPQLTDTTQLAVMSRNLNVFHLGDAVAPPDHVVTGVRLFQGNYDGLHSHDYIGIEIQATKIEANGRLVPETSKWIRSSLENKEMEPYTYMDPDDPVKSDGPALPDSASNHFVRFTTTSFSKDLGQTVLPYLDAQKVMLDVKNSTWLRGIGVYHKARPRFGGFLGLKIITYEH